MADWTTQDPNTLLPGEPWTSAKALAAFENPAAIAEGAPGAPRIALKAIERLVAGSTIRSRNDGAPVTSTTFEDGLIYSFDFMQIGTIRAIITRLGAGSVQVVRLRNGTRTVLSGPVSGNISADVSVQPFDRILLEAATTGSQESFNARFATNGGNLWAGSYARVEGNDV